MFMDRLNKHYLSFDAGNTIIWENATPFGVSDFSIHPKLLALIDSLRKVRPLWRYKSVTPNYGTHPTMARCHIYEGDSPLGEVWIDTHWRNDTSRFYFHNDRVKASNNRNRGGRFTSKLPNAVKEIVKVFYLKTPKERSSEAFSAIHKTLGAADSKSHLNYMRARSTVEQAALAWAERNWEAAKEILGPALAGVDLPEIANHRADMKSLMAAYHVCGGRAVRAEGNGTYLVARVIDGGYTMVTHTDDSLPDILRGGLGLLKLVEVGTAIPNIGVRAEDNIFFVLDAEEPDDTNV